MNFQPVHVRHDSSSVELAQIVARREAFLWVGEGFDKDADDSRTLAKFVTLPWEGVILESTKGQTAKAIEFQTTEVDRFARIRGFVHLIAENPTDLARAPRSLPVFFLNGRSDATDGPSSTSLSQKKLLQRKLNIIDEMQRARPRILVVLCRGSSTTLSEALEMWGEDGFAPRLIVVDPDDTTGKTIDDFLARSPASPGVERYVIGVAELLKGLLQQLDTALPDNQLIVRLLNSEDQLVDIDVTDCEPVEFPLFNRFDLIQSRHLVSIGNDSLSDEQLNQFFEGNPETLMHDKHSAGAWAAYAAGLPWGRRSDAVQVTLDSLRTCRSDGADSNTIILLPSEPGAGGTTLARMVGYAAAKSGFPTMLARSEPFRPDASEVATFLTRVVQKTLQVETDPRPDPTPWLLIFDVSHWRGREAEAVAFVNELARRGRSVILLCVVHEISDVFRRGRRELAQKVSHDLSLEDAVALGVHLNTFLSPRGRAVSPAEWESFWLKHSPVSGGPASFWVALSFWLRRQLRLEDTIQGWLTKQVREVGHSNEIWPVVMEIATLSIERESAPEGTLATIVGKLHVAEALEAFRLATPALGLQRLGSRDRVWFLAHDLLGRLLLKIVFHERSILTQCRLEHAVDPTHLRILLLSRIATRPILARKSYHDFATEFPVNLLKIDNGQLEFAQHWAEVLKALDAMPSAFKESSRTYKHHAAISRRRICNIREYFDLTNAQRKHLLTEAISLLEDALQIEQSSNDDETDSNLFNSLSLAYQDLANTEQSNGADFKTLSALWQKATEAAQKAKLLNPRNSHVLETLARNLILSAHLHPDKAAEYAASALGYVYQAMSLENAIERQKMLLKHAHEAVELLRGPLGITQASKLVSVSNPFGHLAMAWLHLAGPNGALPSASFADFPKDSIELALAELRRSKDQNPLLQQLEYDLIVSIDTWNFADQVNLLDSLFISMPRMPLQLKLERAILLHQVNRHVEANEQFDEIRRVKWDPSNQEYVVVPSRLEWLVVSSEKNLRHAKRVCEAKVIDRRGDFKKWAKVTQLQNSVVPYNPREFQPLRVGQQFSCFITFGHNGPLIKPAVGAERVH